MPKKRSAGLLPYRVHAGRVEVLIVHPGGPFWVRKDDGAWSISKGEYEESEEAFLVAKREFEEETSFIPRGDFFALGSIKQPSGKIIEAWAFEGDYEPEEAHSNMFTMEWPKGSGQQQEFPEVDKVAWFTIEQAKNKILKGQRGFLDRLCSELGTRGIGINAHGTDKGNNQQGALCR